MVRVCSTPHTSTAHNAYFEMFPFELSDFQKYAIEAIVEGNNCLVTAHTGSGKTLPAEFALQHFVELGKKVVYTSPIKALSNQKFYEFQNKYPHISFGLFTGDIKTNPEADVLIMTTEILMNKLFLKDQQTKTQMDFELDIDNDLGCVVFDEVHYINDRDRGQNWEKTILMLPKHIQMVMLSATIDAPEKFAAWCEKGRSNQVYLCSTEHRIVPLGHYGFLTTNESLYKSIKDESQKKEIKKEMDKLILLKDYKGVYNEAGYLKINKYLKLLEEKKVFVKRMHALNNLSLFLRNNKMLPAIIFVFSRKQVEQCAREVTVPLLEDDSKIPYIVKKECDQIMRKLPNHEEYMNLKEYTDLIKLLEKGIGIHHSGMLPVLREIVELMISKKYIKMLFATESFAIGLDCPIKTAVFSGLTKFDGEQMRYVLPHEYTQMAGRAGRRGIDKIGYVVHCNNLFSLPSQTQYKQIMCGIPQKLVSKYKIGYNLILSLLSSGKTGDFHTFSENAMVYNDIDNSIKKQQNKIDELRTKMAMKHKSLTMLQTPYDECINYIELQKKLPNLKNKHRKQAERTMKSLVDQYRKLLQDVDHVKEVDELNKVEKMEMDSLHYLESYICEQSNRVCKVLERREYIENTEDGYKLTEKGALASQIAEVHSLIMAEILLSTNYFETYSVEQIIEFLSIFTDVKVKSDIKAATPLDKTEVKSLIFDVMRKNDVYSFIEREEKLDTGIVYDLHNLDIYTYMEDWCNATNEVQCKIVLKTMEEDKEISTGEFSKALLKISTIAKEIYNACYEKDEYDLCKKLLEVDGKIMKFIVTNQSLYV